MELTEIRIDIPSYQVKSEDPRSSLLAYYTLVFDEELIMYNVKLIQGYDNVFLAFPSQRKCDNCPSCKTKNHLKAKFCNECGTKLDPTRHLFISPNKKGMIKFFNDIVHPITSDMREYVLEECLASYKKEKTNPGSVLPITDKNHQ